MLSHRDEALRLAFRIHADYKTLTKGQKVAFVHDMVAHWQQAMGYSFVAQPSLDHDEVMAVCRNIVATLSSQCDEGRIAA